MKLDVLTDTTSPKVLVNNAIPHVPLVKTILNVWHVKKEFYPMANVFHNVPVVNTAMKVFVLLVIILAQPALLKINVLLVLTISYLTINHVLLNVLKVPTRIITHVLNVMINVLLVLLLNHAQPVLKDHYCKELSAKPHAMMDTTLTMGHVPSAILTVPLVQMLNLVVNVLRVTNWLITNAKLDARMDNT